MRKKPTVGKKVTKYQVIKAEIKIEIPDKWHQFPLWSLVKFIWRLPPEIISEIWEYIKEFIDSPT